MARPLYLYRPGTRYTSIAGIRQPTMPNMGLQILVKCRMGKFKTKALQGRRIIKSVITIESLKRSFSLLKAISTRTIITSNPYTHNADFDRQKNDSGTHGHADTHHHPAPVPGIKFCVFGFYPFQCSTLRFIHRSHNAFPGCSGFVFDLCPPV